MTAEPMVTDGDTPRARLVDPLASHKAADASQPALKIVRALVLELVAEYGGHVTGVQLNDIYEGEQHGRGWPLVRWDTPRKRAGELAKAGLLINCDQEDESFSACWVLTAAGYEAAK